MNDLLKFLKNIFIKKKNIDEIHDYILQVQGS